MKRIRKRVLFLIICGCIAVVGVKLYVNSLESVFYLEKSEVFNGTSKSNGSRKFADLRAMRVRPKSFKKIDFRNKYDVLLTCSFDTLTPWPSKDKMPEKFNPVEILNIGRDPGLGIRELHRRGITGKGVKVAISDYAFLPGHQEYHDKVSEYRLSNGKSWDTSGKPATHGTATASLLVGDRCGVAPSATFYFWGRQSYKDHTDEAAAIEQVLEFNKNKELIDRIRVVSISWGLNKKFENYKLLKKTLKKAKKNGLTVVMVSGGIFKLILGVNCPLYKDRNNLENYQASYSFQGYEKTLPSEVIYAPSDNRTTASRQGEKEYTFWGEGGASWAVPYVAGVIALGYQVNPYLQPDEISKYIRETGTPFNRGWIVNPKAFIEKVKTVLKKRGRGVEG